MFSLSFCPHGDNIPPDRQRDKSFVSLFTSLASSQERERLSDWSAPASQLEVCAAGNVHILRGGGNNEWRMNNTRNMDIPLSFFTVPGFHHVDGLGNSCADLSKIKWD